MITSVLTSPSSRKQREADEPRRLALLQENEQLQRVIMAVRQAKAEVGREVDARKQDKSVLSRQRVRRPDAT